VAPVCVCVVYVCCVYVYVVCVCVLAYKWFKQGYTQECKNIASC